MAVSTHRWRSVTGTTSGTLLKKKDKQASYHRNKNRCIVEIKFENSSYFVGFNFQTSKIYSIIKQPSFVKVPSIGNVILKKLYTSEYVEGASVQCLSRLKDNTVRCFLIATDSVHLEEAEHVAEMVKLALSQVEWNSFRLVVLPKACDVKTDILRSDDPTGPVNPLAMKSGIFEDSSDEGLTEETLETESTRTTYDEDDETRLISAMANSKFRDSRIILSNKKKQSLQMDVDPVERCFVALMKMTADNIFSVFQGLRELDQEVGHILDEGDCDSVG